MKASINENGALKITAENALEAFALKQWVELYEAKKVTLGFDWNIPPTLGGRGTVASFPESDA